MTFVDLVFAVCMLAQPAECKEQHLYFEAGGSLNQCMGEAIPHLARWAGEHPGWRVVRFRCEWAGAKGKQI